MDKKMNVLSVGEKRKRATVDGKKKGDQEDKPWEHIPDQLESKKRTLLSNLKKKYPSFTGELTLGQRIQNMAKIPWVGEGRIVHSQTSEK